MSPYNEMFVIYDSPRDLEPGFAVRRWITRDGTILPLALLGSGLSLAEARALIPAWAVSVGREQVDDPKIVEVWA